ncbi:hypothetical protein KC980_02150 [candidate division WWE3 bacterium]|uniref:Uncharacterized protein n=1 Tax=candidate division WWE3 bacterium TaxID=2053526 RepID=A0A955ECY8_UNCKA|nr:hypothetical protein [candidate division WWE3 bacterium]
MNKLALLLTVVIFTTFTTPVFAQEVDNPPKPRPGFMPSMNRQDTESNKENLNKEHRTLERTMKNTCSNFQARLNDRATRFSRDDRAENKYANLLERLNDIVEKLDLLGLETTNLQTHIAELEAKISLHNELRVQFKNKVAQVPTITCTEDTQPKDLAEELKAYRADLKVLLDNIKAERENVRTFYKEVIREDIRDLREQAKNLKTESEQTNE